MPRAASFMALAFLGCAWGAAPLHADQTAAPATEVDASTDTLTGDWGGLRTGLEKHGVLFNLTYTGEGFGVVSGGLRRGALYNGLLDLGTEIDLEKLLQWPGAHVHVNAIDPHGGSGSSRYVGDLGTFSNLEANNSYRLYEAWLEQDFLHDRFSLRAGQITFDSEFAVLETYGGLFVQSGFGVPSALAAAMPLPAYPTPALGLRLKVEPVEGLTFMAAVFDGNPAPGAFSDPSPGAAETNEDNHFGTHWALRRAEGALIALEVGWSMHQVEGDEEPSPTRTTEDSLQHTDAAPRRARGLAGEYKAGFVLHTDTFADITDTTLEANHSRLAPAEARDCGANYGVYVNVEQELWRKPGSELQGLGAFGHVAWVPADRNPLDFSVEGGVSYRGPLPGRADDALGLGVAYLQVSPDLRRAIRESDQADGERQAEPEAETTIELDYRYQATKYLSLQPSLQYVIQPGGTTERDNALIIGLRTNIVF